MSFTDHRAWIQGVVHFAHLGMADKSRELLLRKLGDGPYRFPAFWPPAIDHAADHNWGGMAMIGLQAMLSELRVSPERRTKDVVVWEGAER